MEDRREHRAAWWVQVERYALYVMVCSLPLQALALVPGTSLTVTKVGGAFLVASVFLRRLVGRRLPFRRTRLEFAIGLFAVACALSLRGSVDPAKSSAALMTLMQYVLVFYAVADVAGDEDVQKVLPWFVIGAAALSGIGGVLVYAGVLRGTVDMLFIHSKVRRVCLGLIDANEQAMLYLFATAFLLFARDLWKGRWRRVFLVASFGAIAVGLVLTMSRTGWLGMAILVAVRILTSRRRLLYGGVLLVSIGLCVGGVFVVKPGLMDAVKRRALEGVAGGDTSITSRVVHYATVVDTAREGGAFGHGLGTTEMLSREFLDPLGNPTGTTVHNVPLIFWMDTGWVGLICFGWLWSSVMALLWLGYRGAESEGQRERVVAYVGVVAMYGFVSLLMPFIYRSAFPILLGCALGALALGRNTGQTNSE